MDTPTSTKQIEQNEKECIKPPDKAEVECKVEPGTVTIKNSKKKVMIVKYEIPEGSTWHDIINYKLENVRDVLEQWKLPKPEVIISVTGGARGYINRLPVVMKAPVKQSLHKVFSIKDSWLITGGTATGIMEDSAKIFATAFKEITKAKKVSEARSYIALGIAPLGAIKKNITSKLWSSTCEAKTYEADLDENHTHFILVDDGSKGEASFRTEIMFRAAVEQLLSRNMWFKDCSSSTNCQKVPIVQLVVEGGPGTLFTACAAVSRDIPLVVFQNTGRTANFIANKKDNKHQNSNDEKSEDQDYLRDLHKEDKNSCNDTTSDKKARCCFRTTTTPRRNESKSQPEAREKEEERLKKCIEQIKDNIKSVKIFNRDKPIEDVVFDAIFGRPNLEKPEYDIKAKLLFCINWNKWDIAEQEIFKKLQKDEKELVSTLENFDNDIFNPCIKEGKLAFIHLFLKYNILTDDQIKCKLNQTLSSIKEGLKKIYETEFDHLKLRTDSDSSYANESSADEDIFWKYMVLSAASEMHDDDMMLSYLGKCDDIIALLIMAASIQHRHAKDFKAADRIVECNDKKKLAEKYESDACTVLNMCFKKDEELTLQLLETKFESHRLMEIVSSARLDEFTTQDPCVRKRKQLWKGQLIYTSITEVCIAVLFFLIPLLCVFLVQTVCNIFPRKVDKDSKQEDFKQDLKDVAVRLLWRKSKTSATSSEQVLSGTCCFLTPTGIDCFLKAPIVKYWSYTISYMVFLLLFSYVVMTLWPLSETYTLPISEIVLLCWAATLLIDEVRQMVVKPRKMRRRGNFKLKICSYFSSTWNRIDIAMFVFLIISVILRCVLVVEQFQWARISYAFTMTLFYVRILQIFYAFESIGPKVEILFRMWKDLVFFVCLLVVFMLAYGVAVQALLSPQMSISGEVLKNVTYRPYWQMYGELFLDEFEGNAGAVLFLVFYMLAVSVVLLNLLIALFSYSFNAMHDKSNKTYQFLRWELYNEYKRKPVCPPPLIVFPHIWRLLENIKELRSNNKVANGKNKTQTTNNSTDEHTNKTNGLSNGKNDTKVDKDNKTQADQNQNRDGNDKDKVTKKILGRFQKDVFSEGFNKGDLKKMANCESMMITVKDGLAIITKKDGSVREYP